MNRQIIVIALLSTTVLAVTALARDLPRPIKEKDAPSTVGTVELFDQGKTIKVVCEGIQFTSRSLRDTDDVNETNLATCQMSVDANAPLILDHVNKKQRLEKALLSIHPPKGPAYTVELSNVAINNIDVSGTLYDVPKAEFSLFAPTSRMTVATR